MYAVLQQYTFDPTASIELNRQIKDGYVPLLRHLPGFVAYYWLDSGAGTGASLCVFEDRASAAAALGLVADRGSADLAALVGPPEVLTGAVTVYANSGL
jgi:hypothetical protein